MTPVLRRWRTMLAGLLLALGATGCSAPPAPPVDLPSESTASASSTPSEGFQPVVPSGSVPPTEGLPTEARAELRGASDVAPDVVEAWTTYFEARAESLRAHEPTRRLEEVAAPVLVQEVAARADADARDGLTVGLRPLGRLQSVRTSGGSVRLTACLWAPSTGFFVEATGEAAEGARPGWVEVVTDLGRADETWRVTASTTTDRRCPGGRP